MVCDPDSLGRHGDTFDAAKLPLHALTETQSYTFRTTTANRYTGPSPDPMRHPPFGILPFAFPPNLYPSYFILSFRPRLRVPAASRRESLRVGHPWGMFRVFRQYSGWVAAKGERAFRVKALGEA